MSVAQAIRSFTRIAETNQAKVDKFAADFAKDPAYALSWGTSVFEAAANLKVAQMLIYAFTPKEGGVQLSIKAACEVCLDRAMNKTRWPAQSTSPASNLMEQYEGAAYANAYDLLKSFEESAQNA